jgi:hypothetical protein
LAYQGDKKGLLFPAMPHCIFQNTRMVEYAIIIKRASIQFSVAFIGGDISRAIAGDCR